MALRILLYRASLCTQYRNISPTFIEKSKPVLTGLKLRPYDTLGNATSRLICLLNSEYESLRPPKREKATLPTENKVMIRLMAGHSHWQNIRHIKAAKDLHKAKVTDKFVKQIELAVRKGGGPDPKLNKMLANTIEIARRTQVVSGSSIENAIKRATGETKPKNYRSLLYELVYQNGILLLVEVETPNVSRFIHEMKVVCKKFPVNIMKGGVKEQFEKKGFVTISGKIDESVFDADEALGVAIEAGAEDMVEIDGDTKLYQFICDANDYFKLTGAMTSNGYSVTEEGIKYTPMVPLNADNGEIEKVSDLCDELEDLQDVIAVHTNIA